MGAFQKLIYSIIGTPESRAYQSLRKSRNAAIKQIGDFEKGDIRYRPIKNESDLNRALVIATPKIGQPGVDKREKYHNMAPVQLYAAYHFIQETLKGEKKEKYEKALLQRAERYYDAQKRFSRRHGKDYYETKIPRANAAQLADHVKWDIIDKLKPQPRTLEAVATAIVGIVSGIFFLSPSLTGNVIGVGNSGYNLLGLGLLVAGLAAAYYAINHR